MAKGTNIQVNSARIRELILEQGKSLSGISAEMGMSSSFLSDIMRRGSTKPLKVQQLAKLLEVPINEITALEPEPQAAQTEAAPQAEPVKGTPDDFARISDTLWCINYNLEQLVKSFRPASIRLTPVEDCCLLLAAMTRYGQCMEDVFWRKATELGFDEDTIRMAKDLSGIGTKVYGGNKWLERRR